MSQKESPRTLCIRVPQSYYDAVERLASKLRCETGLPVSMADAWRRAIRVGLDRHGVPVEES